MDGVADGREAREVGESIAQRSRRSQRGGIGVGRGRLSVGGVADGRETRDEGKASHRGYGGHRGGNWRWAWKAFGGGVADGRETREEGKASHRGHGGHRGEIWRWAWKALGGRRGFQRNHHQVACFLDAVASMLLICLRLTIAKEENPTRYDLLSSCRLE